MKPPIFLDNNGDLTVFDSVEKALAWIEPIDVLNNEYSAFDSNGNSLLLQVDKGRISANVDASGAINKRDLINKMADFLKRSGKKRDLPESCTFENLVEKFRQYYL